MSRSNIEHDLEEVRRFLDGLSSNPLLTRSTDAGLKDIANKAQRLKSDLDEAIHQVHRHWKD